MGKIYYTKDCSSLSNFSLNEIPIAFQKDGEVKYAFIENGKYWVKLDVGDYSILQPQIPTLELGCGSEEGFEYPGEALEKDIYYKFKVDDLPFFGC